MTFATSIDREEDDDYCLLLCVLWFARTDGLKQRLVHNLVCPFLFFFRKIPIVRCMLPHLYRSQNRREIRFVLPPSQIIMLAWFLIQGIVYTRYDAFRPPPSLYLGRYNLIQLMIDNQINQWIIYQQAVHRCTFFLFVFSPIIDDDCNCHNANDSSQPHLYSGIRLQVKTQLFW